MIDNPDVVRQLVDDRRNRLRREAAEHRLTRGAPGPRRAGRTRAAFFARFVGRRRPAATPRTATA